MRIIQSEKTGGFWQSNPQQAERNGYEVRRMEV